jgi:tellurite resistance protein TerC
MKLFWRQARRLGVAVIGTTVLLVGLAMVFLPGPAVVVVPAGIAILATEFLWAHRLLNRIQEKGRNVRRSAQNWRREKKTAEEEGKTSHNAPTE